MKSVLRMSGAYVVLVVMMFILWMAGIGGATALVGHREQAMGGNEGSRVLAVMLFVCAVNTAVLVYVILRSRWHGLRLAGVMALQIFGIQFFISQIETLYFNYGVKMPEKLILAIVIGGFVLAVFFSLLAVLLLGRMRENNAGNEAAQAGMPRREFAIKFVLLAAVVYPLLYFMAGHFIAWQFEDVRRFYTGSTYLASFAEQFRLVFTQSWLYPYQILRGALWILIALPLIRMLKGSAGETAVVVALLFSCLMSMQLLLPNPYMPGDVAFAHFLETFSSNALWGTIIVWVMHRHHASIRELIPF